MGRPILMKLAPEVGLIEIFQKPSWFCSLTFSSKVKWGGAGGGSNFGRSYFFTALLAKIDTYIRSYLNPSIMKVN